MLNLTNREKLSKLIIKARGSMSKSAFGRLLGVSHTAISGWENGTSEPEPENLVRIAEMLEMSVDDLLVAIGKSSPNTSFSSILSQIKTMNFDLNQIITLDNAVSERLKEFAR